MMSRNTARLLKWLGSSKPTEWLMFVAAVIAAWAVYSSGILDAKRAEVNVLMLKQQEDEKKLREAKAAIDERDAKINDLAAQLKTEVERQIDLRERTMILGPKVDEGSLGTYPILVELSRKPTQEDVDKEMTIDATFTRPRLGSGGRPPMVVRIPRAITPEEIDKGVTVPVSIARAPGK